MAGLLALVLVMAMIYIPSFLFTQAYVSDSYAYLTLAKSLSHFHYYCPEFKEVRFPPVYPLGIAAMNLLSAGRLGYENSAKTVSLISLIVANFLVLDLLLIMLGSRRRALVGAAVGALAPAFIIYSGGIGSEPLFAMFCLAVFDTLARKRTYLPWMLAGLALLTRYEGYLLLPALLIFQFREPRHWLLGMLICLLMSVPWWIFISQHLGPFFAYSYFQELVRPEHTGLKIFVTMAKGLSPLAAALGLAGLFWKRTPLSRAIGIFIILFVAIHLFWYFNAYRFSVPLVPFFAVGLLRFFSEFDRSDFHGKLARQKLLLPMMVVLLALPQLAAIAYAYAYLPRGRQNGTKEIVEKLKGLGPNPAVVGDVDPVAFQWYGGGEAYPRPNHDLLKRPYDWVLEKYFENGTRFLVLQ